MTTTTKPRPTRAERRRQDRIEAKNVQPCNFPNCVSELKENFCLLQDKDWKLCPRTSKSLVQRAIREAALAKRAGLTLIPNLLQDNHDNDEEDHMDYGHIWRP